jgi:ectoine hydroxylase-related dioxygenase (phytanoyl-CoA dioxygenase family)
VRGIYATLPDPSADEIEDHLHTDGHPFHVGVVCLLEDCPPDGGGFKIWPGSHRRFYPLFPMQYDQARIPYYEHMPAHKGLIHPQAYLDEVEKVEADTPPVDCFGGTGDLVFWHHRMGHMAGNNRAEPPSIRQALLFDFCKTQLDAMRLDPPQADMWRDWGEELRDANVPVSRQLAAEQRLPLILAEQL